MPFEDAGDDGPRRPPPDPLDRLWVHPSELSSRGAEGPSPAGRRKARDWLVVVAAGAVGAAFATGLLAAAGLLDRDGEPDAAEPIASLAARAAPGVVTVVAATAAGERRGSGVAVADGWVLATCATLDGARSVTVASHDGDPFPARVEGRDGVTGLTLLRVAGLTGTVPARTGDPVEVGERVIALGSGGANRAWVTTGVVSSVAAQVLDDEMAHRGLIATDAEAEPTAAGGALLDADGRVVGVLTAADREGSVAVPIGLATDVAGQLRRTGRVGHGWAGIAGVDASGSDAGGVLIERVAAGSPAARAGLRTGDVVVAVDEERLAGMGHLVAIVRTHEPGAGLDVTIRRDGRRRAVHVRLGDVPPDLTTTTTTAIPASAVG
jgi:putative serine protease PepD